MVVSRRFIDRVIDVAIYAFVGLCGFLCLVPLINTLALSFSDSISAAAGNVTFWPKGFNVEAYRSIVADKQFLRAFGISAQRLVLGGGLNFIMMVLAAFPLAHSNDKFHGRNIYMWFIVFTMLFGAGMIPTFLVVKNLGLLNTIWSLVLPGAVPTWNCVLLMNFFRNQPRELEEAAEVDGANPFQILLRVFLPISLPGLATVMLFSLVGHWNEFFNGLIYMTKAENYPLATYISQMVKTDVDFTAITDIEELERLMKVSNKTMNSAKIFVSMIPIMVVYPFLQRYFVKGMVLGAVKD